MVLLPAGAVEVYVLKLEGVRRTSMFESRNCNSAFRTPSGRSSNLASPSPLRSSLARRVPIAMARLAGMSDMSNRPSPFRSKLAESSGMSTSRHHPPELGKDGDGSGKDDDGSGKGDGDASRVSEDERSGMYDGSGMGEGDASGVGADERTCQAQP